MDGDEFTNHYTILADADTQTIQNTIDDARALAGGDELRIWFVREGDGDEDEDAEDYDPGGSWIVEHWCGQFVNCLGFFVSTEPCKPEHLNTIFIY